MCLKVAPAAPLGGFRAVVVVAVQQHVFVARTRDSRAVESVAAGWLERREREGRREMEAFAG